MAAVADQQRCRRRFSHHTCFTWRAFNAVKPFTVFSPKPATAVFWPAGRVAANERGPVWAAGCIQRPCSVCQWAVRYRIRTLLHQVAPVLGQLAQHIAIQSAVTQQIGVAVHQLAHQLALQGLQGFPGGGFGAGQGFAGASQPYIGGAQPYGQLGLGAGAYGGFNPQAQGWGQQAQAWGPQGQGWGPQGQPWGANRPQTIQ